MKKRFAVAAAGLALAGAAALPTSAAFGSLKGRPFTCAALLQEINILHTEYHAPNATPQGQAVIALVGNRALNKYDNKGCDQSLLPTLP